MKHGLPLLHSVWKICDSELLFSAGSFFNECVLFVEGKMNKHNRQILGSEIPNEPR